MRVESRGWIEPPIADRRNIGSPIKVFALIKLERQREEDLDRSAQADARWPEMVDCYLITGQHVDLMRIVVFGPYERFVKDEFRRIELARWVRAKSHAASPQTQSNRGI